MRCPACHASNPPENQRCQSCGENLPSLGSHPSAGNEIDVLPADAVSAEKADTRRRRPRPSEEIDDEEGRPAGRRSQEKGEDLGIVSVLIPYKNPKALAAYYCGFFALIPGIGFVLGVLAIVLGILGMRYSSANPTAKGAVHAITGIVLGVVALFCWNPLVCLLLWFTYFYTW